MNVIVGRMHVDNLMLLHGLNYLLFQNPNWTVDSFLNQRRPKYAPLDHHDDTLQKSESDVHDDHRMCYLLGILHMNH